MNSTTQQAIDPHGGLAGDLIEDPASRAAPQSSGSGHAEPSRK
jgi:hypothetical protein